MVLTLLPTEPLIPFNRCSPNDIQTRLIENDREKDPSSTNRRWMELHVLCEVARRMSLGDFALWQADLLCKELTTPIGDRYTEAVENKIGYLRMLLINRAHNTLSPLKNRMKDDPDREEIGTPILDESLPEPPVKPKSSAEKIRLITGTVLREIATQNMVIALRSISPYAQPKSSYDLISLDENNARIASNIREVDPAEWIFLKNIALGYQKPDLALTKAQLSSLVALSLIFYDNHRVVERLLPTHYV